MDKPSSTLSVANSERRTKPISQKERELTAALDFLVRNLTEHMDDYHHKTDRQQVKRSEGVLEDAISELIARKERDGRGGFLARWRKRQGR